jgi:hypothetical protein
VFACALAGFGFRRLGGISRRRGRALGRLALKNAAVGLRCLRETRDGRGVLALTRCLGGLAALSQAGPTSVLRDRACGNPKRRQREAQRALQDSATRTRAQAAWSAAMETEKGTRASEVRAKRREIEERKYQLRVEKRKQARRGK